MSKKHNRPKRHGSSTKASKSLLKRVPPSVPKSVMPCPEYGGYITDYINVRDVNTRFLFKKTADGYDVYIRQDTNLKWICIKQDISFSPTTRNLFKTQPTLSKAIAAVESWIESELPDIR